MEKKFIGLDWSTVNSGQTVIFSGDSWVSEDIYIKQEIDDNFLTKTDNILVADIGTSYDFETFQDVYNHLTANTYIDDVTLTFHENFEIPSTFNLSKFKFLSLDFNSAESTNTGTLNISDIGRLIITNGENINYSQVVNANISYAKYAVLNYATFDNINFINSNWVSLSSWNTGAETMSITTNFSGVDTGNLLLRGEHLLNLNLTNSNVNVKEYSTTTGNTTTNAITYSGVNEAHIQETLILPVGYEQSQLFTKTGTTGIDYLHYWRGEIKPVYANINSPIEGEVLYYSANTWINKQIETDNFYLSSVTGSTNSSITFSVTGYGDIILDTSHNHEWTEINNTPTTLNGYGILDAYTITEVNNNFLSANTSYYTQTQVNSNFLSANTSVTDIGGITLETFNSHTGNTNNPHETTLVNLTDTQISNISEGQMLHYVSGNWVNYTYVNNTGSAGEILLSDGNSGVTTDTRFTFNKTTKILNVVGIQTITAPDGTVQKVLEIKDSSDNSLYYVDSVGVHRMNMTSSNMTNETGYCKYKADENGNLIWQDEDGTEYICNIDHYLNLLDVEFGVPLNGGVPIYNADTGVFNQMLTGQYDDILKDYQSSVITGVTEANNIFQLKNGYALMGILGRNTTTTASVNTNISVNGTYVVTGATIAGDSKWDVLYSPESVLETVALNGNDYGYGIESTFGGESLDFIYITIKIM